MAGIISPIHSDSKHEHFHTSSGNLILPADPFFFKTLFDLTLFVHTTERSPIPPIPFHIYHWWIATVIQLLIVCWVCLILYPPPFQFLHNLLLLFLVSRGGRDSAADWPTEWSHRPPANRNSGIHSPKIQYKYWHFLFITVNNVF